MNIMPKLLAASLVYILASTAVDAADKAGPLPAKVDEIGPAIKSPFSGAYIGAHAGYSQLTDESDFKGWNGGGHIGFNAPMGNGFIAGLEADATLSAANLRAVEEDISLKVANDWIMSLRGRLGYQIGNVMPYATAGVAWARFTASETDTIEDTTARAGTTERLWVIGGGVDYSIPATNLIAGIGVLHYFDDKVDDGMTTVRGSISVKLN